MSGTIAPAIRAAEDPKSDTFRVAKAAPELFDDAEVDGFVEGALDDSPPVPISEGTVQIRRFESPLLKPVPVTKVPSAKPAPIAERPSWVMQLADTIPMKHEKVVVAGILFFFLFGVLSSLAAVTMLLFVL